MRARDADQTGQPAISLGLNRQSSHQSTDTLDTDKQAAC